MHCISSGSVGQRIPGITITDDKCGYQSTTYTLHEIPTPTSVVRAGRVILVNTLVPTSSTRPKNAADPAAAKIGDKAHGPSTVIKAAIGTAIPLAFIIISLVVFFVVRGKKREKRAIPETGEDFGKPELDAAEITPENGKDRTLIMPSEVHGSTPRAEVAGDGQFAAEVAGDRRHPAKELPSATAIFEVAGSSERHAVEMMGDISFTPLHDERSPTVRDGSTAVASSTVSPITVASSP